MATCSRREVLKASLAIPVLAAEARSSVISFPDVNGEPSTVTALAETGGAFALKKIASGWAARDVHLREAHGAFYVQAGRTALSHLYLRWHGRPNPGLTYLGDAWERSYGDLGWRGMDPERILPWYLLASQGDSTIGVGVKTGAGAFCYWQVDDAGITLVLDVRNGGRGVLLGDRELLAAAVVSERFDGQTAFSAAQRFCRLLCTAPRLPKAPVYGGNNWYYAYGKSSADDIRRDSERIAAWSPAAANRPFMVIDDGWQPFPTAGPWERGGAPFPDMPGLAAEMRRMGVRPGLWVRPLITQEAVSDTWKLSSPGARREANEKHGWTLDPTVPGGAGAGGERHSPGERVGL